MTMTAKQVTAAIKKCKVVYGWVSLTTGDGAYVKIEKQNLLAVVADAGDSEFQAVIRDCGNLYLN